MKDRLQYLPPLALEVHKRLNEVAGHLIAVTGQVRYFAQSGADLVFVTDGEGSDNGEAASGLIQWRRSGRFLNCFLSNDFFRHFASGNMSGHGQTLPLAGKRLVVEHTSMTPIYPINVATYRSTVIGDHIARCLTYLGAEVTPHFWLQDNAGQLDLLPKEIPRHVLSGRKVDHCSGALFTYELSKVRACPVDIGKVESAFPLAIGAIADYLDHERQSDMVGRHEVVKLIQDCFSRTLDTCECQHVMFDLHSEICSDPKYGNLRDSAIRSAAGHPEVEVRPKVSNRNYFAENVVYYSYLLSAVEGVYSVVPIAQRGAVGAAADFACRLGGLEEDRVRLVGYGEVFIDGLRDRPSALIFNSLDELLERGGRAVIARLNDKYLRYRTSTRIDIDRQSLSAPHPTHRVNRKHGVRQPSLRELCLTLDESWYVAKSVVETAEVTHLRQWLDRALHLVASVDDRSDPSCTHVANLLDQTITRLANPLQRLVH